jgi:hypothetical protein
MVLLLESSLETLLSILSQLSLSVNFMLVGLALEDKPVVQYWDLLIKAVK